MITGAFVLDNLILVTGENYVKHMSSFSLYELPYEQHMYV